MEPVGAYTAQPQNSVEDFLDYNLLFLIDPSRKEKITAARSLIGDILPQMPPVFQSVIVDTNTKFVYCDKKYFKANIDKSRNAAAIGHELYFKADSDAESLRHEIGHVIDTRVLLDHPRIREYSLRGHFTSNPYTSLSDAWKKAVEVEISSATSEGWLARKYGDCLYDGDNSLIGRLKGLQQKSDIEAFAELTRKYLSLYALNKGDEEKIDAALGKTYAHLWPVYRDEVIPEIMETDTFMLGEYNACFRSAMYHNGKLRYPIEIERPDAWCVASSSGAMN